MRQIQHIPLLRSSVPLRHANLLSTLSTYLYHYHRVRSSPNTAPYSSRATDNGSRCHVAAQHWMCVECARKVLLTVLIFQRRSVRPRQRRRPPRSRARLAGVARARLRQVRPTRPLRQSTRPGRHGRVEDASIADLLIASRSCSLSVFQLPIAAASCRTKPMHVWLFSSGRYAIR
jgi:hypothetical protein